MKVCVLNFSGNVGKSTVAGHLLHPRMKAPVLSVESLNIDASTEGVDVERIRSNEYREIQERIIDLDSVIVDVGASNIETFIKLMQQHRGSHEELDWFVVPVVKDDKQQGDTLNTIRTLRAIGVPASKIRVVINRADTDDNLDQQFAAVKAYCDQGNAKLPAGAVIYENELFAQLKLHNTSVQRLLDDPNDYRQIRKDAASQEEKERAIDMLINQRLARSCSENLDAAYKALFA